MPSAQLALPLFRPSPPPAPAAVTDRQKAQDILTAVRTLKTIDNEKRAATPEEKQVLTRFGGFGAVALRIFPDPVTGEYKDASPGGPLAST